MKRNCLILLMAIFMGIFLPVFVFSIAEKLHADEPAADVEIVTTEQPEQNESAQITVTTDYVWVQLEGGLLQQMDMDAYLTGVLLGELPADFDNETLKAQAIVARTYAKKRSQTGNKHLQGAVCTVSSCCQAYCSPEAYIQKGGKTETILKFQDAVNSTKGIVLTYQGELIDATYFSCSGGRTEDALAVWGKDVPYLQAVDSPGEENATHYADRITMTSKEFTDRLGIALSGSPSSWIGAVHYTTGGGVDSIVIGGKTFAGVELRKKLNLYSTAFSITTAGDSIHISTKGFGHRVGMSQYGAEAMAVKGSGYQQILAHYYPGTQPQNYLD